MNTIENAIIAARADVCGSIAAAKSAAFARAGRAIANGQLNTVEVGGLILFVILIIVLLMAFVPGAIEDMWKAIMSKVGAIQ